MVTGEISLHCNTFALTSQHQCYDAHANVRHTALSLSCPYELDRSVQLLWQFPLSRAFFVTMKATCYPMGLVNCDLYPVKSPCGGIFHGDSLINGIHHHQPAWTTGSLILAVFRSKFGNLLPSPLGGPKMEPGAINWTRRGPQGSVFTFIFPSSAARWGAGRGWLKNGWIATELGEDSNWLDGWMVRWLVACLAGLLVGWLDGWMDGWCLDGWYLDGWLVAIKHPAHGVAIIWFICRRLLLPRARRSLLGVENPYCSISDSEHYWIEPTRVYLIAWQGLWSCKSCMMETLCSAAPLSMIDLFTYQTVSREND